MCANQSLKSLNSPNSQQTKALFNHKHKFWMEPLRLIFLLKPWTKIWTHSRTIHLVQLCSKASDVISDVTLLKWYKRKHFLDYLTRFEASAQPVTSLSLVVSEYFLPLVLFCWYFVSLVLVHVLDFPALADFCWITPAFLVSCILVLHTPLNITL